VVPGARSPSPIPQSEPVLADFPREHVLEIRLNRPARRNAIDLSTVRALLAHVEAPGGRVVVISSSEPACFCAGADLGVDDAERAVVSDRLYELYGRIIEAPVPVLAALQGPAVGGGAQIAVAADMRIADATASLRFVGPGHGLAVGAWALGSLVGRSRAIDLCLSMRRVAAAEALALGLIDRVVPDPRAAALDLAEQIASLDPGAVTRVKRIVRDGAGLLASLRQERAGNRDWSGSVPPIPRDV
jgi:enoyl-CoA hydratase/carnithine racemase